MFSSYAVATLERANNEGNRRENDRNNICDRKEWFDNITKRQSQGFRDRARRAIEQRENTKERNEWIRENEDRECDHTSNINPCIRCITRVERYCGNVTIDRQWVRVSPHTVDGTWKVKCWVGKRQTDIDDSDYYQTKPEEFIQVKRDLSYGYNKRPGEVRFGLCTRYVPIGEFVPPKSKRRKTEIVRIVRRPRSALYHPSRVPGGILLRRNLRGQVDWYWRARTHYLQESPFYEHRHGVAAIYWTEITNYNFDLERWLSDLRAEVLSLEEARERREHRWEYYLWDRDFEQEIDQAIESEQRSRSAIRRIVRNWRIYNSKNKASGKIGRVFLKRRYRKRTKAANIICRFWRSITLRRLGIEYFIVSIKNSE